MDTALGIFVVRDLQPLQVVENEGLRYFVAKLDPQYELPSRKTLTEKILPELYRQSKEKLAGLLNETDFISITTDCWTSVANESYLGITAHFFDSKFNLVSVMLDMPAIEKDETAESLSEQMTETFQNWCISSKIKHITTDNAPNMKAMADSIPTVKHFPCFAHSLNLVVKNSLNNCSDEKIMLAIQKAKDLVTFFHQSSKATRILKKMKIANLEHGELVPGKLVQYASKNIHFSSELLL